MVFQFGKEQKSLHTGEIKALEYIIVTIIVA
jgi:hypothetical protein